MNQAASSHRADDDELRGWIAEAGDVRVEPRPEYVDHVRRALLERVAQPPEPVIAPEEVETPLGIGLVRIVAVACLCAAALFAAVYPMPRHGDSWASIAKVLQEKTWIHCVTIGSDGFTQQNWYSPRFEILAMRYDNGAGQWGAEYHDLKANIKTEYILEENTIYRLSEGEVRRKNPVRDLEFFQYLSRGEGFKVSPYPDTEIIAEHQREVVGQGKTWKIHELTIRGTIDPKFQVKMTIHVDPVTGLPRTWNVASDKDSLQQFLDYPATGPVDIHAMAVPATAKFVDHIPADDLDQVLTSLKIGRERFDDYCAYVWVDKTVYRVWRKGRQWRVELAIPANPGQPGSFDPGQIPDDSDLDWWTEHEQDLLFRPEALFNSQTTWFFHYAPNSVYHPETDTWDHQSVSTQYAYRSPDDPIVALPHLMPEQIGHTRVESTDPNWEFFVNLKPVDGPPNTLLLRVHDIRFDDPKQPDIYRLWIDPRRNHLALRAESLIVDARAQRPRSTRKPKPSYVQTQTLEKLRQSPNWFWYPTQVVLKTSNSTTVRVTRFVLDFRRPIPDELFLPPK